MTIAQRMRAAADKTKEPLPYEARRWCNGDQAWTKWQPCSAQQFARYREDESMQTRTSPAWKKWRDAQ